MHVRQRCAWLAACICDHAAAASDECVARRFAGHVVRARWVAHSAHARRVQPSVCAVHCPCGDPCGVLCPPRRAARLAPVCTRAHTQTQMALTRRSHTSVESAYPRCGSERAESESESAETIQERASERARCEQTRDARGGVDRRLRHNTPHMASFYVDETHGAVVSSNETVGLLLHLDAVADGEVARARRRHATPCPLALLVSVCVVGRPSPVDPLCSSVDTKSHREVSTAQPHQRVCSSERQNTASEHSVAIAARASVRAFDACVAHPPAM
jgi:hypothetical protein